MEATSDEMISSEEWISLSGFYTTEEEAEFMTQFLGNCIVQQDVYGGSSSSNTNLNLGMIPSSSSSSSAFWPSGIISSSSSESLYLLPSNVADDDGGGGDNAANCNEFASMMSMGFPCSVVHHHSNEQSSVQMMNEAIDEDESVKEVVSEPEREVKRSRSSIEMPKNKRNVKSKKNSNSSSCSSYCSSEDDSSASQEAIHGGSSSCLSPQNNNTTLKSNGKSRSNRGPATDPQSVYARRRRERINERLRILQNLVPNGTKVDISTMLEEAVQYVKFLQLQIKLLSSDDMWMYAPIAYNGMNIGLDLNITPTKQP